MNQQNLFLKWRLIMTTKTYNEVDLLKKQIAEEVKEKYSLYKRIKELTEELEEAKNKNIFNWKDS